MNIVIITRGSSGIGAATALACAQRGMGVILTYNSNPGSAADVVAKSPTRGGEAVALSLDVADTSSLDVADTSSFRALAQLKGQFSLTQTLLPLIADGGQIINLTSATSRVATAGVAPYASFKGGLEIRVRSGRLQPRVRLQELAALSLADAGWVRVGVCT